MFLLNLVDLGCAEPKGMMHRGVVGTRVCATVPRANVYHVNDSFLFCAVSADIPELMEFVGVCKRALLMQKSSEEISV